MYALAIVFAAVAAFAAPYVAAQTVYKSTLSNGHVVYGTKPEKSAARVEKLAPAAPIVEVDPEAAAALRQLEKTQGAELDQRVAARKAARTRAEVEIAAAEDAVGRAEQSLASGREPLPGERVSTVDGGSRLSEAHFDRIQGLEEDVKAAKERLDRARRELLALD